MEACQPYSHKGWEILAVKLKFIRWKGRYAYLEHRYLDENGRVKSRSRYLGQNYLPALEKMLATGEIDKHEFRQLSGSVPEGRLNLTVDGGLGIGNNIFRLFENHKIAIFINNRWLSGIVAKDEYGWHLKDNGGNIVGLCPGMRARQVF